MEGSFRIRWGTDDVGVARMVDRRRRPEDSGNGPSRPDVCPRPGYVVRRGPPPGLSSVMDAWQGSPGSTAPGRRNRTVTGRCELLDSLPERRCSPVLTERSGHGRAYVRWSDAAQDGLAWCRRLRTLTQGEGVSATQRPGEGRVMTAGSLARSMTFAATLVLTVGLMLPGGSLGARRQTAQPPDVTAAASGGVGCSYSPTPTPKPTPSPSPVASPSSDPSVSSQSDPAGTPAGPAPDPTRAPTPDPTSEPTPEPTPADAAPAAAASPEALVLATLAALADTDAWPGASGPTGQTDPGISASVGPGAVQGIDISRWDTAVDIGPARSAGVRFVIPRRPRGPRRSTPGTRRMSRPPGPRSSPSAHTTSSTTDRAARRRRTTSWT